VRIRAGEVITGGEKEARRAGALLSTRLGSEMWEGAAGRFRMSNYATIRQSASTGCPSIMCTPDDTGRDKTPFEVLGGTMLPDVRSTTWLPLRGGGEHLGLLLTPILRDVDKGGGGGGGPAG